MQMEQDVVAGVILVMAGEIIMDGSIATAGQLRFLGNGRLDINAGGSVTVKLNNHELKVNVSSGGRLRGA